MGNISNSKPKSGPVSQENWRAFTSGAPFQSRWEVPLYTDAYILGEARHGPYHLINSVAGPLSSGRVFGLETQDPTVPSIILRIEDHHPEMDGPPDMSKTDVSAYHGGGLADEVAALVSLCLGIRLKAGGMNRRWSGKADPLGRPCAWESYRTPTLLKPRNLPPILPRALGQHTLSPEQRMDAYPKLGPDDARVLIRAARLYQDGLWIAESEPELAWVMLVSAVEAAAGRWSGDKGTPLERLEASRPELAKKLREVGGEGHANYVAGEIEGSLGAFKKFYGFLRTFMPNPPPVRPAEFLILPWDQASMEVTLRKVYSWRSKALHDAVAFPAPMCDSPFVGGQNGAEVPMGLAAATGGGAWLREDTPLLLATFEYIVREALLAWWSGLAHFPGDDSKVSKG